LLTGFLALGVWLGIPALASAQGGATQPKLPATGGGTQPKLPTLPGSGFTQPKLPTTGGGTQPKTDPKSFLDPKSKVLVQPKTTPPVYNPNNGKPVVPVTPVTVTPLTPVVRVQPTIIPGQPPPVVVSGVSSVPAWATYPGLNNPANSWYNGNVTTTQTYNPLTGTWTTSTTSPANPYLNNPYLANPYTTNPYLNNPYATNPYAANPYLSNQYMSNPYLASQFMNNPYNQFNPYNSMANPSSAMAAFQLGSIRGMTLAMMSSMPYGSYGYNSMPSYGMPSYGMMPYGMPYYGMMGSGTGGPATGSYGSQSSSSSGGDFFAPVNPVVPGQ